MVLGGTWVNFCWVCAAGLSEPLPHYIIVYSVANYRPHDSLFWENMLFSQSQLSHFLFLWIDQFFRLNEEHFTFHLQYKHSGTFADPNKSENVWPHSSNSVENATPL